MIRSILVNIYLQLYYYYSALWKYIFDFIGKIIFIYHVNENRIKNITWNYYSGYGMNNFKSGTFYAKIYNADGTHHIAYNGEVSKINNLVPISNPESSPRRKNVILLNDDKPINVDLAILDNYKINMLHFDNSLTNLGMILKLIGLNCTHVTIIQTIPFNKKTIEIDQVDIHHLYH